MSDLRTLVADDWVIWRKLRLAALTEAPHAFEARLQDWQGAADAEERWRARLEMPGSVNLIASLDGEPGGMVSGVLSSDASAVELTSMWVAPHARGTGVAGQLVEGVFSWARGAGAGGVTLCVYGGNRRAISFYEACGFRFKIRTTPDRLQPDRQYPMVRDLTRAERRWP